MAHFDERDGLSRTAAALRLALIILPITALMLSLNVTLGMGEELKSHRPFSLTFLIAFRTLFPLTYLAFCLWAATAIKPIKFLNAAVLKWMMLVFSIALPIVMIYYDHQAIGSLLKYFTKGGAFRLAGLAGEVSRALSFAAICVFVVYKFDAPKKINGEEMSRAAAGLRRILIVLPIIGLIFFVLSSLTYWLDPTFRDIPGIFLRSLQDLIVPLSYLAIGLWAANLIQPIKSLDLQNLKWALIGLGTALPVLVVYNDTLSFVDVFGGREDGKTWVFHMFEDGPSYFIGYARFWFNAFTYAVVYLFVAYKIETAEREIESGLLED